MTSSPSPALTARLAALTAQQRALLRAKVLRARPQERLTPGQRRLWETHYAIGGQPADVVCQAVHLTGATADLDLLAERAEGFVRDHEALRTTFQETDGEVRPVVHETLPPWLTRAHCATAQEAQALARELAHEPFDLASGPLLRVVLATGPVVQEAWLLVVVHNLVFDAWSFDMLLDALARDARAPAPATTPFSRWARDQAAWVADDDGRAAAEYWTAEVDAPPPPLPTDRPRSGTTARNGNRVEFSLPPGVNAGIAALAKREAASVYAGWLAVAWAALEGFGGRADTLLGTFTAGRDRPGAETVVGYLLNVLPVRLRDPADGSWTARVRAAGTISRAGLRHAAYPGELIDVPRRVPGTHPLFDAVFVFDNLGETTRTIQGAAVSTADVDKGTARYDLTLAVYPRADGVTGWLEYDTELYEETTARRLAELFTTAAEEASREGCR
ncbi:condensation domain-containing protein [Streptomyces malaysiensis]|uniref:condensation domain-containing protein n=1 Tax=Streptomyces malaysiensis TaxID=92644 RepID=UPI002B311286|nr:condensation domain-containing protein [Streptomyces malaysiensis]